ncbi:hypothetical protein [Rickettsiales endosymbiont of Stachyamoeba lipophora]|uniref:hypothetical protein n=1 Tax=Rickettsiales endosymbiont of Stachyamoeba lipophora TaxID=2486578 RepID=UPI000F652C55|nr:hypothetical protein [Rickettsiales endosymbiont of Stachyamoeba lipophora]AZL15195.1 hypothetical protein EF513_01295 [Rickettsiales endosymbiont of Stachyamoeba lipophora]
MAEPLQEGRQDNSQEESIKQVKFNLKEKILPIPARQQAIQNSLWQRALITTAKILGVAVAATLVLFAAGRMPILKNIRMLRLTSDIIGNNAYKLSNVIVGKSGSIIPEDALIKLNKGFKLINQQGGNLVGMLNNQISNICTKGR